MKGTISIILSYSHDTDSWNPYPCSTRTCLVDVVNIMAADGLGINNYDIDDQAKPG